MIAKQKPHRLMKEYDRNGNVTLSALTEESVGSNTHSISATNENIEDY